VNTGAAMTISRQCAANPAVLPNLAMGRALAITVLAGALAAGCGTTVRARAPSAKTPRAAAVGFVAAETKCDMANVTRFLSEADSGVVATMRDMCGPLNEHFHVVGARPLATGHWRVLLTSWSRANVPHVYYTGRWRFDVFVVAASHGWAVSPTHMESRRLATGLIHHRPRS
jgi:hypothetical protein